MACPDDNLLVAMVERSIDPAQFPAWLQQDYLYVRGIDRAIGDSTDELVARHRLPLRIKLAE